MDKPVDREAAVADEIKRWTDTQFPKGCRVGSAKWVNGLARRVLARLDQEAAKPPAVEREFVLRDTPEVRAAGVRFHQELAAQVAGVDSVEALYGHKDGAK